VPGKTYHCLNLNPIFLHGQRDDPQIRNQVALLNQVFKTAYMEMAVPAFLYRIIPSLTGFDVKQKYNDLLKKMMNTEVESHKRKLVPGEPKASRKFGFKKN